MRLQLLSDLHLESNPGFTPEPAPDADLLVLAGDIGSYQSGSALSTLDDPDFGLGRFSPLRGWPVPVLFVPGNHERRIWTPPLCVRFFDLVRLKHLHSYIRPVTGAFLSP